jgi:hypothetical protein
VWNVIYATAYFLQLFQTTNSRSPSDSKTVEKGSPAWALETFLYYTALGSILSRAASEWLGAEARASAPDLPNVSDHHHFRVQFPAQSQ